jgi:hypothetical protein
MINLLGISLGPEQLLMQPNFANPKGYWEHDEIVSLNDEILGRFGGSWDHPPTFPPGWANARELDDLKEQAQGLIKVSFAGAETWAWKDPRTCLTLPFWQQLLPDLRYLVCLRNPVDVARSLEQRDGLTSEQSSDLWLTYVNSALEHSEGRPRLVMFYEDLMGDWLSEFLRLADFLGKAEMAKQADIQKSVQEFVEKGLQHHRTSVVGATANPRVSLRARALFIAHRISVSFGRKETHTQEDVDNQIEKALDILSQYSLRESGQANPLIEQMAALEEQLIETRKPIRDLQTRLREQDQVVESISAELVEREQALKVLSSQLSDKEGIVQRLSTQLEEKDELVQRLSTQVAEADQRVQMLSAQLLDTQTQLKKITDTLPYRLLRYSKHRLLLPVYRRFSKGHTLTGNETRSGRRSN